MALLALAGVGCGDDGAQASSDDGVAGSGSEATDTDTDTDPDPSAGEPTSDSGGSVDSGDSGDSTGGELSDDTRVVYEVVGATSGQVEVIDVIDGVPSEPSTVYQLDAREHFLRIVDRRWLLIEQQDPFHAEAFDLTTAPPFASWSFDELPAATLGHLDSVDATGSVWVFDISDGVSNDFYAVDMTDDGPGQPWHVDADVPAGLGIRAGTFAVDNTRFVFSARDLPTGMSSIWFGPIDAADPPPMLVVEANAPGEEIIQHLYPTGTLLVYFEGQGSTDQTAYVVDLASEPVGAPMPVATIGGATSSSFQGFAPDESGFAALQATNVSAGTGDFVWVAIDNGVPQAPVALTTGALAGLGREFARWSSDGRWAAFTTDAPPSVHLVRFDAGAPAPAVTLASNANTDLAFAPDADYVYFAATTQDDTTVFQRVALDGDAPGAAEVISPAYLSVDGFELAADGRSLAYLATPPDDTTRHAFWIDLSGADPEAPIRLDADVDPSGSPGAVSISSTGKTVLVRHPTDALPYAGTLVDTTTLVQTPLADDASIGTAFLLPLL